MVIAVPVVPVEPYFPVLRGVRCGGLEIAGGNSGLDTVGRPDGTNPLETGRARKSETKESGIGLTVKSTEIGFEQKSGFLKSFRIEIPFPRSKI
jgi:hypothetical protein